MQPLMKAMVVDMVEVRKEVEEDREVEQDKKEGLLVHEEEKEVVEKTENRVWASYTM